MNFLIQASLLAALCTLAVVVRQVRERRNPTLKAVVHDTAGIAALVLVFALVTGGKGCAIYSTQEIDCQPSPHGYICSE